MAIDPHALGPEVAAFLAERHLASLTTLRPDGTPHVVPVGFSYDADARLVRIITARSSRKVANITAGIDGPGTGAPVAVTQIDGGRWLTLEGTATVSDEEARVAEAERRYGERYQAPRPRNDRVVIEVRVTRILGRV